MNCNSSVIVTSSIVVVLSACSTSGPTLPENPVVGELAPMNLPAYKVGQQVDYINQLTGEPEYWMVTDVANDGTVSSTMSTGCKWSSSSSWFDAVGHWEDCGTGDWSAATSTALNTGTSLWPLNDGASAEYKFKRTNKAGESGTHQRTCNVSTANIDTGIGPLDTYKVVCKDSGGGADDVRTWYFNPEHGEIQFTRWKPEGGIRTHQRYL